MELIRTRFHGSMLFHISGVAIKGKAECLKKEEKKCTWMACIVIRAGRAVRCHCSTMFRGLPHPDRSSFPLISDRTGGEFRAVGNPPVRPVPVSPRPAPSPPHNVDPAVAMDFRNNGHARPSAKRGQRPPRGGGAPGGRPVRARSRGRARPVDPHRARGRHSGEGRREREEGTRRGEGAATAGRGRAEERSGGPGSGGA
jgi:hypothetical protein